MKKIKTFKKFVKVFSSFKKVLHGKKISKYFGYGGVIQISWVHGDEKK